MSGSTPTSQPSLVGGDRLEVEADVGAVIDAVEHLVGRADRTDDVRRRGHVVQHHGVADAADAVVDTTRWPWIVIASAPPAHSALATASMSCWCTTRLLTSSPATESWTASGASVSVIVTPGPAPGRRRPDLDARAASAAGAGPDGGGQVVGVRVHSPASSSCSARSPRAGHLGLGQPRQVVVATAAQVEPPALDQVLVTKSAPASRKTGAAPRHHCAALRRPGGRRTPRPVVRSSRGGCQVLPGTSWRCAFVRGTGSDYANPGSKPPVTGGPVRPQVGGNLRSTRRPRSDPTSQHLPRTKHETTQDPGVSVVRTVVAAVVAALGIAWMVVYINVAQDGEKLTWMGDLERWNFLIGFGLVFLGLALAANPGTCSVAAAASWSGCSAAS